MLQYILECIAFQLVFLIIYDLFLKRETFFQWNRLYLIGTYIISMVLPWIKIEAMKTAVPETFQGYPDFLWSANDVAVTAIATEEASLSISWEYALLFGGMFLATLFFGYKLYQIYTLKRKGEVHYFKDFTQVIISNSAIAFSFFKSIFLGDKVIEKEYQSILEHELVHIRQKHSYDLMFFELMRIVGWFNPLVYVYQSRVSELHEFIADAQVAKTNKKEQYEFLLSQVFQTQNISFINQFFKSSLIKKRIVMLTKEKSKQILHLKYLLLVPVIFGILAYTSIETQKDSVVGQKEVVNDANLIAQITVKIQKEVEEQGSLGQVHYNFTLTHNINSEKTILSKENYFEYQLLNLLHYHKLSVDLKIRDASAAKDFYKDIPLPSSSSYENYVNRKKSFQLLDENLRFSITSDIKNIGLGVMPRNRKTDYPDSFYVIEVEDVSDLTGDEVKNLNNRLHDVFEVESKYSDIILMDNNYAFQIYKLEKNQAPLFGSLQQDKMLTNTGILKIGTTIEVYDVESLTEEEEIKLYRILISNSEANHNWEVAIKDENTSMKIVRANDGSYLSGPNGEKIAAKLVYDSKLSEESKLSITEFLKNNGTTNFSVDKTDVPTDKNFELKGTGDSVPFATVDKVPVFPGCEDVENKRKCFNESMQRHISKNFNYPKEAQERGIQGRVNVMFMISKKGRIEGLRMQGPDSILEKEVERIINRLPKMKPGRHRGKKVDVPFSIPVTFKLDRENTYEKIPLDSNDYEPKVAATARQYNQLVTERNRLLRSSNEKNPIIVNLDQQLNKLRESLSSSLKASVDSFGRNVIGSTAVNQLSANEAQKQYIELVKERKRLLESSNEKNPIIVNLDQQIKALKEHLDQEGETVPFATIDEVPVFPGCEDADNRRNCFNKMMQKHISKNFNYPKEAQEKGIQGRVAVMFTIATDGSIQNIRKRGPDSLLENETVRIIKRLPKMKPGKQKGKVVNVPFSIPITFKLNVNNTSESSFELSKFINKTTLLVIDGEEYMGKLNYVDKDNIETFIILEDEAAFKKYGEKGKNGVVEIITKKKN